jgi:hypothetical protein
LPSLVLPPIILRGQEELAALWRQCGG